MISGQHLFKDSYLHYLGSATVKFHLKMDFKLQLIFFLIKISSAPLVHFFVMCSSNQQNRTWMHSPFLDNYENFCTLCYKHGRNFLLWAISLWKSQRVFCPEEKRKKRKLFIHPNPTEVSVAKTTLPTCINRHRGFDCRSYRHYGVTCSRLLVAMATELTSYRIKYYNLQLLSIQYHTLCLTWFTLFRFDAPDEGTIRVPSRMLSEGVVRMLPVTQTSVAVEASDSVLFSCWKVNGI